MLIKISRDFSTAPGPRRAAEGKYSGEQFRREILLPKIREAIAANDVIIVDLDGTSGYGTSFLEESFAGLIREDGMPLEELRRHLVFTSNEEPDLLSEINEYMEHAESERIKAGGRK